MEKNKNSRLFEDISKKLKNSLNGYYQDDVNEIDPCFFGRNILKIPTGAFVHGGELQRQAKIYDKYVEAGEKHAYNAQIGLMQVMRDNPLYPERHEE